jgi:nitroimidazol reductase NimA-like FMN-containing flavoprotein (pyridoxamine 5'-phosphate oxidase superfamily)
MSAPPLRRIDKLMSEERTMDLLARGYCGRIASAGADGWPYCMPLLYVWTGGEVLVHTPAARGHLRANVDHDPRVCFEVDEPGEVFNYGRFECDSAIAYSSVIVFGAIRIVEDGAAKATFFDAFMAKYGKRDSGRPEHFYPRLADVTVYAIAPERITGKETPLPAVSEQWPAKDRTKSPDVTAP